MNGSTISEALLELRNRPASVAAGSVVVKTSDESRYALFVAYSANKMPLRGADGMVDVASPEVLEKAAWRFMLNGARIGVDHKPGGENAARVVENFVHRGKPMRFVGPDGTEQVVRKGDWCVGVIFSPAAWTEFKKGRWGGVSLQGSATRKPASAATLARQGR